MAAAIPESHPSRRALGIPLIVSRIFEAIENEEEESLKVIGDSTWHNRPSTRREKNNTLAACAVVNRLWHAEAVRVLYGKLAVPLYANRKRGQVDDLDSDSDDEEIAAEPTRELGPWIRYYDNLLHRVSRERRQHIARQVHTLELFVSPYRKGCNRLLYAKMLSRLEFPRLRRLKLEGVPDPVLGVPVAYTTELFTRENDQQSSQPNKNRREQEEQEAYKALFSAPNLVHLDLSEPYAFGYALYLESENPSLLVNFLPRLTGLSIRVMPGDHPNYFRILQHSRQLQRLELFDVAEIFPQKSTFSTILAIAFIAAPSLEVLHINRCTDRSEKPSEGDGWPDFHKPPRPLLRELVFEGLVHWANLLLQHIEPSIMETLHLRLRANGVESINLGHLADRAFPKLKSLSISRYPLTVRNRYQREIALKAWTIPPQKLLSILDGTPSLTHLNINTAVGEESLLPCHLEIDIDNGFLTKLGARLPRLEHLEIKNNPSNTKWTSAGFIALGKSCRYLTHFEVGGHLDITDPVFEDTLREHGLVDVDATESVTESEIKTRAATGVSPLFPCLRDLVITSSPPRESLSDEYPTEAHPRAPPETVTRLHRLLTTHFPYLVSLSRIETESLLQMELRRKYATGDWPTNRLSHFASPWYVRLTRAQVMWKFETRRRNEEAVESHDSDSHSDIDSEDGRGAYESDSPFEDDDFDSEDEYNEKQNFGGRLRQSTAPVTTE